MTRKTPLALLLACVLIVVSIAGSCETSAASPEADAAWPLPFSSQWEMRIAPATPVGAMPGYAVTLTSLSLSPYELCAPRDARVTRVDALAGGEVSLLLTTPALDTLLLRFHGTAAVTPGQSITKNQKLADAIAGSLHLELRTAQGAPSAPAFARLTGISPGAVSTGGVVRGGMGLIAKDPFTISDVRMVPEYPYLGEPATVKIRTSITSTRVKICNEAGGVLKEQIGGYTTEAGYRAFHVPIVFTKPGKRTLYIYASDGVYDKSFVESITFDVLVRTSILSVKYSPPDNITLAMPVTFTVTAPLSVSRVKLANEYGAQISECTKYTTSGGTRQFLFSQAFTIAGTRALRFYAFKNSAYEPAYYPVSVKVNTGISPWIKKVAYTPVPAILNSATTITIDTVAGVDKVKLTNEFGVTIQESASGIPYAGGRRFALHQALTIAGNRALRVYASKGGYTKEYTTLVVYVIKSPILSVRRIPEKPELHTNVFFLVDSRTALSAISVRSPTGRVYDHFMHIATMPGSANVLYDICVMDLADSTVVLHYATPDGIAGSQTLQVPLAVATLPEVRSFTVNPDIAVLGEPTQISVRASFNTHAVDLIDASGRVLATSDTAPTRAAEGYQYTVEYSPTSTGMKYLYLVPFNSLGRGEAFPFPLAVVAGSPTFANNQR